MGLYARGQKGAEKTVGAARRLKLALETCVCGLLKGPKEAVTLKCVVMYFVGVKTRNICYIKCLM